MAEAVVDTNVWAVADEQHESASLDCIEACLDLLVTLKAENTLAVDCDYYIIGQYRGNISVGGFVWKLLNELEQHGTIALVYLSRDENDSIFSSNGPLDGFDPADRKFVLVALQSDPPRPVYNATDPDWQEHESGMQELGLAVHELCPCELEAGSQ